MASADAPVMLTRVLHPCVLLEHGATRILIDPCFGAFTRRSPASRIFGVRMPEPGLGPEALGDLSAIAFTHGHEDHFDAAGLARLPSRTARVIAGSRGVVRGARRLGFTNVERLAPWERAEGTGWEITAVPARSPNAWSEIGFVVSLGGLRVFHGGDTAVHRHFAEIGRRLSPKVACLPVNGVTLLGVRLTMTPKQAARAARELGVRVAVPIHDEMAFTRISSMLYRTHGDGGELERELSRVAPEIRVLRPQRGAAIPLGPGP